MTESTQRDLPEPERDAPPRSDVRFPRPDGTAPTATSPNRPGVPRSRRALKHSLLNVFIALVVFVLLADGLPMRALFTKRLKAALDPFLDATGLWQDNWKLFAPNVDKINTYIEGRVFYNDGSEWRWTSTDWDALGLFETFFYVRHIKLWDLFRRDNHKAAWPALAEYVLRQAPDRGAGTRPTRVELYRHWWDAAGPKNAEDEWAEVSRVPPPREEFPESYRFYRKVVR